MGTWLELSVSADGIARDRAFALMDEAFAEAARLESVLSFFDSGSDLARANRAAPGALVELAPELAEVLALGARVERLSRRAFRLMPGCACPHPCYALGDSWVVRRSGACVFDLGGIAKGYVVDRVFGLLERRSGPGADLVVNAGGDLRCSASPTGRRIEVRVPSRGEGERRHGLVFPGGAVATSSLRGDLLRVGRASALYEATGPAGFGAPTSVSVLADSCAVADALTKAALFGAGVEEWGSGMGARAILSFDEQGLPEAS